jgi:hypothetical protein
MRTPVLPLEAFRQVSRDAIYSKVHARDQQNERDCAEPHEQLRLHIADKIFLDRNQAQGPSGGAGKAERAWGRLLALYGKALA